mgnify:CR=1 FL=1
MNSLPAKSQRNCWNLVHGHKNKIQDKIANEAVIFSASRRKQHYKQESRTLLNNKTERVSNFVKPNSHIWLSG